ncbi:hypothetical protein [Corynebacterium sp. TAE3-ERU2]|uniref:hypothetical protein n=1 Tax=Corynebacterium sp. TAE3-ERU2 TaxID=2849497 RepID=UPI002103443B|nr:hypothetical protein [Corynebacterium sp. TAE3-ERU2]
MTEKTASQYDDPRRPLVRAMKMGSLALVAVTVLSVLLWWLIRDLPGVWGVLLGAAIGGGFVLLTVLSTLLTSHTSPEMTGVVVLGGWLVKIVVLIIVLWALRDLTFYDPIALVVTTIAALVIVLGAEVWAIMTTKVTTIN